MGKRHFRQTSRGAWAPLWSSENSSCGERSRVTALCSRVGSKASLTCQCPDLWADVASWGIMANGWDGLVRTDLLVLSTPHSVWCPLPFPCRFPDPTHEIPFSPLGPDRWGHHQALPTLPPPPSGIMAAFYGLGWCHLLIMPRAAGSQLLWLPASLCRFPFNLLTVFLPE